MFNFNLYEPKVCNFFIQGRNWNGLNRLEERPENGNKMYKKRAKQQ